MLICLHHNQQGHECAHGIAARGILSSGGTQIEYQAKYQKDGLDDETGFP